MGPSKRDSAHDHTMARTVVRGTVHGGEEATSIGEELMKFHPPESFGDTIPYFLHLFVEAWDGTWPQEGAGWRSEAQGWHKIECPMRGRV